MKKNISVHLVIVGSDPINNDFSVALIIEDDKVKTVQNELDKEPEIIACDLASKYITAPSDWYSVRKQNFIVSESGIHLIYTVTIPKNIKLKKNIKWYSFIELTNMEFVNDIEKDILIEGVKL